MVRFPYVLVILWNRALHFLNIATDQVLLRYIVKYIFTLLFALVVIKISSLSVPVYSVNRNACSCTCRYSNFCTFTLSYIIDLFSLTLSTLKFFLADVEAIVKPVVAVPDLGGPGNAHLSLKDHSEWRQNFVEWLQSLHHLDNALEPLEDEADEEANDSDIENNNDGNKKRDRKRLKVINFGCNSTRNGCSQTSYWRIEAISWHALNSLLSMNGSFLSTGLCTWCLWTDYEVLCQFSVFRHACCHSI